MILLKKLYSDTALFDKVEFRRGINVIKGVYTKSKEEIRELNGIGKSTLIRLIDFALLSDTAKKKYFDVGRHRFLNGHSVALEFEDGGTSYFIKRKFDDPGTPEYGSDLSSLESYDAGELKKILGNIFFGKSGYKGYFESIWFRNLIKFFIKDDIDNFERTDPLNFITQYGRQYDIYSYNMFLMDLPNQSVVTYDGLKKDKADLQTQHRKVITRLRDETGKSIEEINSEIIALNEKINTLDKSIGEYKFSKTYEEVGKEISEISKNASSLRIKSRFLERKLDEYKKSYEYEIEIDEGKIAKMYTEVGEIFGEIVKKNLDEVIKFRKGLAENRERFLEERELGINNEIGDIRSKLVSLEEKRAVLYKMLDEKHVLDGIKNTYSLLIEEKTKQERLLTSVAQVKQLDDEIGEKNNDITKSISNMAEEMRSIQGRINNMASLYQEIVKETIHVGDANEAVFDIRASSDMRSPLKISIDVPKSEALGKARYKILAYDYSVFLNIVKSKRNLPYFLIHDGVFHGIDIKTVIRILNYINSKFLQYQNFQYIITANESEIFIPPDKKPTYGQYDFDLDESIVATYKDVPEGMIFKIEY